MSLLSAIIADLREKRLWPVAVALVVAIVAVPVVLAKTPPSVPAAPLPSVGLPADSKHARLSVAVDPAPKQAALTGPLQDPFGRQPQAAPRSPVSSSGAATTSPGSAAQSSGTSPGSTPSSASAPAATASVSTAAAGTASGGAGAPTTPTTATPATTSTTTTPTTTPTTTTPTTTSTTTNPTTTTPTATPTPRPTPTGLTATQSYHVTLAITNSAGGLDKIDPLPRLSLLPSKRQPLLVELGVLKGGHRVLFAVQPGTVVSGPGTCTPGPIDCEILSLAQDQTESLSMESATGVVSVAEFAVTAIKADEHPSAAAADKARRMTSAAGRDLLSKSTLNALSLFQYDPSRGDIVDLRNLTVGGS